MVPFDNSWHQIVLILDNTNMKAKFYVDGGNENIQNLAVPIVDYNTPTTIGRLSTIDGYWFNGSIDEVAIYNRALNITEIQGHYYNSLNNGVGYCAVAPDLIPPTVNFATPTPANGFTINVNSTTINVSVSENASVCKLTWTAPASPESACGTGDTAGMLAYWQGENNTIDLTGVHSATWDGTAKYNSSGKVGKAFDFSGGSQFVNINGLYNFTGTHQASMELWAYFVSITGTDGLVWTGTDINGLGYNRVRIINNPGYYVDCFNGEDHQTGYSFSAGKWVHLVMTDNNSIVKAYADGKKLFVSSSFYLGMAHSGWDFNGLMDEVAIYNRTLTDGGCAVGQQCGGDIGAHFARSNASNPYCTSAPTVTNYTMSLTNASASTWANYTISNLSTSSYTYSVTCNDTAGNVGQTGNNTLNVDVTPPTINFTDPTPTNGLTINVNSTTIKVNVSENASVCKLAWMAPGTTCPDGMISYWKLDEGTGTTANDSVDSNPGTIFGAAINQPGKVGTAYSFDNSTSTYLDLGNNRFQYATTTVEFWVNNLSAQTTNQPVSTLFMEKQTTSHEGCGIYYNANIIKTFCTLGGGSIDSNTPITDNNWHHITAVFGDSGMKLYQDGVLVGNNSATLGFNDIGASTNTWAARGRSDYDTGSHIEEFFGSMDEIAISCRKQFRAWILYFKFHNQLHNVPHKRRLIYICKLHSHRADERKLHLFGHMQ
jgi:hypothetical protein